MAEEQISPEEEWKEYLEERMEALLLQELLKWEEHLRQERMLILELAEEKIKRVMRKLQKEEINGIEEETTMDGREQSEAWRWLEKQLKEGVKGGGEMIGGQEEKEKTEEKEESCKQNNKGRGLQIRITMALVKMMETPVKEKKGKEKGQWKEWKSREEETKAEKVEKKGREKKDQRQDECTELERKEREVVEVDRLENEGNNRKVVMETNIEENWEEIEKEKKTVAAMRREIWGRMYVGQQRTEGTEQKKGVKVDDIVTWMEHTKKAILDIIGVIWKEQEDDTNTKLWTRPPRTPEEIEKNQEEIRMLSMSKPKLQTDFSIFMMNS
ncbi:vicilin-like seed storage protein At2g18540 [Scleropages formosus]|uniref:vicilin-like seed storage protein At2g18540 n=1 Tax=Scleropages formosus TaxID=113540 RepID=UPI000878B240|nr:vicilin-like seed storage protein At2g18540 [Scleropages formosus]